MNTRQAIIRLQAVIAALDEGLAHSLPSHAEWNVSALRSDLDLDALRREFEREHAALQESARSTRHEADHEAKEADAWARRAAQAAIDGWEGAALLQQQALVRQREHSTKAAALLQETAGFEQLVADYAAILAELQRRTRGSADNVPHDVA